MGLWPGCVVAAFDVPLGHLPLDDAGCGALTANGVEPAEQSAEEREPAGAVACVLVIPEGAGPVKSDDRSNFFVPTRLMSAPR